ncbi:MAG: short-chain dehydrogenase/reductase [Hydrocarboniphaga sp.]|uniref:SDR family NAD(P)-dependent oxidoreductase n=1 Tax=Hydrocarboniphaga sp. TaxID=2033016 RepID=UPI002605622C|nr:SDR family oxidoreductase [Hydrocarboniphaga sp.]MDB5968377.1 short-chain dehydrogenase/reductase [Hydrocarboniphaga sp.]
MFQELRELKKGAAVIIGGSGGLGIEISRSFARVGSAVAFNYHQRAQRAEALHSELADAGARALMRQADLADVGSIRALFDAAEQQFGSIHTVVYASGPTVRISAIADLPPEEWAGIVNADVNGFFNLVHVAIPALRRSRGSLVALSTAGTRRFPPLDVMSAGPKASVEMLVQGIAREEGRNGIRANCVGVGHIDAGQGLTIQQDPRGKRLAERVLAATPLRRLGTAADIANAVLFFASPMASFISGEMLCVDGGGHV